MDVQLALKSDRNLDSFMQVFPNRQSCCCETLSPKFFQAVVWQKTQKGIISDQSPGESIAVIDREAEAQEAPEHPSPRIACWERISEYGNTLGPVACNMKSCNGFRSSVKVTP